MTLPDLDRPLTVPPTALRIGVVGAGRVVRDVHLPAYRAAGLTVQVITDRPERCRVTEALAAEFAIPHVVEDALALVAREDVDVIDLAIPDEGRLRVVEAAARHGKHLLVASPLAHDFDTARRMVEITGKAGVKFAIHQGARWSPAARAVRTLLEADAVGKPWLIRFEMLDDLDSQVWARTSWRVLEARYRILHETIHALDLTRVWMGREPERVWCALPRRPGQKFRGELTASIAVEFAKGGHAQLLDHGASLPGRGTRRGFLIEGSHGVVEGDLVAAERFTVRLARDEEVRKPDLPDDEHVDQVRPFDGAQGALGSMADLLSAIESGREPEASGVDHLKTLALVDACYRSAASGAAVSIA